MTGFQTLRHGVVAAFREQLSGRLVSPTDTGYDKARRVWNGRIDRRPALVAFCANDGDVMAAVRFAREHELLVAVRCGGNSAAGTAVCDDGLVIDLSLMKSIEVDVAARTANAQGGALWRDLDRTTQSFGLAVPGGTDSEVGIAGLTSAELARTALPSAMTTLADSRLSHVVRWLTIYTVQSGD
jgi:FAD/FMN-containing dehydrogenase